MQDSPDAKKPCKGILKNSSSFDKPGASSRKSAKFDELNVLQTYHPVDKDYGHMKIDEPKTPYNYAVPDPEHVDALDASLLAEKLRIAAHTQTPSFGDEELSDEEFTETAIEKVRRLEFERRRKAHYKEFEAVKLARKLIQEELGDEDEDEIDIEDEALKSNKGESEYAESDSKYDGAEDEEDGNEESQEGPGAAAASAAAAIADSTAAPGSQEQPRCRRSSASSRQRVNVDRPMEVDTNVDSSLRH